MTVDGDHAAFFAELGIIEMLLPQKSAGRESCDSARSRSMTSFRGARKRVGNIGDAFDALIETASHAVALPWSADSSAEAQGFLRCASGAEIKGSP